MRLALVALTAACTTAQVRTAHHAGEIMAGGGLIGIMATVATAELLPDDHSVILRTGVAFVPVAVVGALLYAATDSTVNRPEAPDVRPDRNADLAMDLAKQAKHAARRGDCAEVLALEPRVRELDAGIYRRFCRDKIIGTCLPPAPPEPDSPALDAASPSTPALDAAPPSAEPAPRE